MRQSWYRLNRAYNIFFRFGETESQREKVQRTCHYDFSVLPLPLNLARVSKISKALWNIEKVLQTGLSDNPSSSDVTYALGIQKTLLRGLPSFLLGIKLVTQHLTLVVC